MNNELLLKLSPFSNIQEEIKPWNRVINALDSDDVIGTVLRLHLMCEQALEARICAICNQENLFGRNSNGNFIIEFDSKAKMALALGLNKTLFNLIKKINTIRNQLAHTSLEDVPSRHIESCWALTRKLADELKFELDSEFGVKALKNNGEEIKITFGDENLSLRDKFILVSIVALMGLHFPDS